MRVALAVPALVLAALAPCAQAAPTATPAQGAAAHFQVVSGSRVWEVMVLATTPDKSAPQVRMRVTSPDGTIQRVYGELPAGALTSAGSPTTSQTVTLRTRVGSAPLTMTWQAGPGALAGDMGQHDSDESSAVGWSATGEGAGVAVALGALRCRLSFGIVGTAVTYGTTDYGRRLATGVALPLRGAACRDLPSRAPTVP